ncbi:hypothetical protein MT997_29665 [Paenibacillus sp. OVF10]|nr:hypothetical protein MT997_29665 [Paenibacillus sp. OVF10]
MVAAIQGISAVITPLLTTTLYQVDKHVPFMLVAVLVVLLAIMMLGMRKNQSNTVADAIHSL